MELQDRFSKWLTSAQPVFWINGEAGSGKSSLMSYIESHERTHDLLKIWAGKRRLHVFSFFLWRAGSEIQKSISGVLQSLLFQLARAKPEIIGGLVSGETSAPHTTWTQARLHRAIEKALSHFIGDRIFVLIDGLDEFEGSHTALTSLVLGLQNGSHSKFCLSSRPEAALTRELGSFPSLRLQDLNYDDIESFVHGQLKSYENVYGDPWQFRQMTRKVSSRAEGIFLWAALVCRSLISGFESKDDADMLRQRLDVMPSGLEALFELMFSNIDREHREYLSKCFFLLKWSRENGSRVVSDVSIPVITTFLSVSPHRSLSDFMQDCRLVEHRVVARAKGLLETYEPSTSMFDTLDIDLQKFGLCILSDAVSGEPGYRFVRQESKVTEMFRIACIGWVHRSAYDYVLGDNSEHTQSWRLSFDEKRLLRRLLDAQSWLARCFPGQHMDPFCPPAMRIANVITGRTDEVMLAGFQALDELHDIIEAALHRRRCTGTDGIPVIDVDFSGVFEEAKPLRAFWASLLNEPLSEYVVTRFDKIKSSAHVDILCSGLIKHWFGPMFGTAQTECTVPAITMSLDHLLHQGPLGSAVIVDPQVDSMIPDSKLFRQICISWRGRNRSIERRMVSDVAYALIKTPDFYRPFRATEDTKPNVEFHHPSPSAAERGESLIELSDLWNIYCGRKRNVSSTKPFIPLCLHVPIWIYWWEYRRYADVYRANSSDRVLPAWRFVCFGQERNRVHQRRPSEHVPAVAWFDVTAAKSKRLMDQFGLVRRARINLGGTSREKALCLETILEEVWADADGQFDDGWQQLYMLTCLKRYFGALWRIPKSYGIEHDGNYK